MARPISDQELQLKKRARRRLVGAIVLVTAVAVILPMVLDSEPKPVQEKVDIHIPSPDSAEFKPRASSAGQPATPAPIKGLPEGRPESSAPAAKAESPAANAPPARQAEAPAANPAPERPAEAAAESPKAAASRPAAKPEPPQHVASAESKDKSVPAAAESTKAAKATPSSGAYFVQVAALADASKAKQLQKQMSGAGLKAYTEVIATKTGEITRVRAGPYATREAAEKARAQLKKAGLDGQVVSK